MDKMHNVSFLNKYRLSALANCYTTKEVKHGLWMVNSELAASHHTNINYFPITKHYATHYFLEQHTLQKPAMKESLTLVRWVFCICKYQTLLIAECYTVMVMVIVKYKLWVILYLYMMCFNTGAVTASVKEMLSCTPYEMSAHASL